MPPSQLNQLKASLNKAGLARDNSSSKKRKGPGRGDQRASSRPAYTPSERQERISNIQQKFNRFDVLETRSKHEVLGRKLKGTAGNPTARISQLEESVCTATGWISAGSDMLTIAF